MMHIMHAVDLGVLFPARYWSLCMPQLPWHHANDLLTGQAAPPLLQQPCWNMLQTTKGEAACLAATPAHSPAHALLHLEVQTEVQQGAGCLDVVGFCSPVQGGAAGAVLQDNTW